MQSEKHIFDDLAKMINGVAGTMAGAGREAEASMRERMREWVGGLDLISREEFDAVKEMAAKARAENDKLLERIEALEGKSALKKPAPKKAPAPKAAPKAAPKKVAAKKAAPKKATSKKTTTKKTTAKK